MSELFVSTLAINHLSEGRPQTSALNGDKRSTKSRRELSFGPFYIKICGAICSAERSVAAKKMLCGLNFSLALKFNSTLIKIEEKETLQRDADVQ